MLCSLPFDVLNISATGKEHSILLYIYFIYILVFIIRMTNIAKFSNEVLEILEYAESKSDRVILKKLIERWSDLKTFTVSSTPPKSDAVQVDIMMCQILQETQPDPPFCLDYFLLLPYVSYEE